MSLDLSLLMPVLSDYLPVRKKYLFYQTKRCLNLQSEVNPLKIRISYVYQKLIISTDCEQKDFPSGRK